MAFTQKQFDFWKYKAFFCFGNEQFKKAKEEYWIDDKEKLIDLWGWLIALKSNYKEMMKAFDLHNKTEKERRKKEQWAEKIITYELNNYECFYLWYISDDAMEVLKNYWYKEKQIIKIFNKKKENYSDY